MQDKVNEILDLMDANTNEQGQLPTTIGIQIATIFKTIDDEEKVLAYAKIYTGLKERQVPVDDRFVTND